MKWLVATLLVLAVVGAAHLWRYYAEQAHRDAAWYACNVERYVASIGAAADQRRADECFRRKLAEADPLAGW